MSFLNGKADLNNKIKEQEEKIALLESEKQRLSNEKDMLITWLEKLRDQNMTYDQKYIHTNRACPFCYTTLQKEFVFCPHCGREIVKMNIPEHAKVNPQLFQTEEDGDSVLITQYNGFREKTITIPSFIDGKPVVGIWNNVFEKCTSLQEVIFEEGCQYLGKNVFAQCENLRTVHLPKSLLEIGDYAFRGCGIQEIVLPPNIKVIGNYAFQQSKLEHIVLPENLKYISRGMFFKTPMVRIDIPKSVLHIAKDAFCGTKLILIELPQDLYSIGSHAFDTPTLSWISIPSNVKLIGQDIFGQNRPKIYCSAGSKALLYARKYGLFCSEIPSVPISTVQICASSLQLVSVNIYRPDNLAQQLFQTHPGIYKAATWSWCISSNPPSLAINKAMGMEDACHLKKQLEKCLNNMDKSRWVRNLKINSVWDL